MGIEIERKFLVIGDGWRRLAGTGCRLRQGYLAQSGSTASVRVRCAEDRAFLTIKSARKGPIRSEFEYEIPITDAEQMLRSLCRSPPLEKTRFKVQLGELTWEIDVFLGELDGLVTAEVELDHVDQHVDIPQWVGPEVTNDPRYQNAALSEAGAILRKTGAAPSSVTSAPASRAYTMWLSETPPRAPRG